MCAEMWAIAALLVSPPPGIGCAILDNELRLSDPPLEITILLAQRQGVAK